MQLIDKAIYAFCILSYPLFGNILDTSGTSLLKIRTSMNKNSESSPKISVPSRFEWHQDQLSNRQGQYPWIILDNPAKLVIFRGLSLDNDPDG